MPSKQQILDDFTSAMKNKDEIKKRALSAVKAEIIIKEKSASGVEITEDTLIDILKSMEKKRKESIEAYEKADRPELVKKEREELEVIEEYLPVQMTEEEIRTEAQRIVDQAGFSKDNFGQAMGMVMRQLKGKADGNIVGKIVKEIL